MKMTFQRAALRATARIVFGSSAAGVVLGPSAWALGLVGCGGQALGDEPTPDLKASGASAGSSSVGSQTSGGSSAWVDGGSTEAEASCAGPVAVTLPPTLPGPTDAEYTCCLGKVSSAANDWFSDAGKELAASEPIANCCRVLIAAVDVDGSRYAKAGVVHTPCCSLSAEAKPDLYQHLLCTPWGPPMPPALDWPDA